MNVSMDPTLLQMVQQDVNKLIADFDKMVFEVECDRETVKNALRDFAADVKKLKNRLLVVEKDNQEFKRSILSLQTKQIVADDRMETVEQRVTQVEEQFQSSVPKISFGEYNIFSYQLSDYCQKLGNFFAAE